jgi:hypothetical protein
VQCESGKVFENRMLDSPAFTQVVGPIAFGFSAKTLTWFFSLAGDGDKFTCLCA